jgi:hypothetical protein
VTGGNRPQSGSSAIGLLAVVAVLAVIVGVVLAATGGDHKSPGASPRSASSDIAGAARVTCRTDYQAVRQAVDAYTAQHGQAPASMSDLAGLLRDPVTSAYFTISIGPGGQVEVAAPGHTASPGDGNCDYSG